MFWVRFGGWVWVFSRSFLSFSKFLTSSRGRLFVLFQGTDVATNLSVTPSVRDGNKETFPPVLYVEEEGLNSSAAEILHLVGSPDMSIDMQEPTSYDDFLLPKNIVDIEDSVKDLLTTSNIISYLLGLVTGMLASLSISLLALLYFYKKLVLTLKPEEKKVEDEFIFEPPPVPFTHKHAEEAILTELVRCKRQTLEDLQQTRASLPWRMVVEEPVL